MTSLRPALVVFLVACGGAVATAPLQIPSSQSDFPAPSSDASPYDPRFPPLLDVAGGAARVGSWDISPQGSFSPSACLDGGERVVVAPFRLMETEVTYADYAICVDAASCQSPDFPIAGDWRADAIAHRPVILSWGLARTFCRHYGGDLPTMGQFARASSGDDETYGVPAMTSLWTRCHTGATTVGCSEVVLEGRQLFDMSDVRTLPADRGPFGHLDLFGNASEWERSLDNIPGGPNGTCPWPLLEHDVARSPETPNVRSAYLPVAAVAGFPVGPWQGGKVARVWPDEIGNDLGTPVALTGFRCSFPMRGGS